MCAASRVYGACSHSVPLLKAGLRVLVFSLTLNVVFALLAAFGCKVFRYRHKDCGRRRWCVIVFAHSTRQPLLLPAPYTRNWCYVWRSQAGALPPIGLMLSVMLCPDASQAYVEPQNCWRAIFQPIHSTLEHVQSRHGRDLNRLRFVMITNMTVESRRCPCLSHCCICWLESIRIYRENRRSSWCASTPATMAEKSCTIRTRKFMKNKLLQRRQFVSTLPLSLRADYISLHTRAEGSMHSRFPNQWRTMGTRCICGTPGYDWQTFVMCRSLTFCILADPMYQRYEGASKLIVDTLTEVVTYSDVRVVARRTL